MAISESITINVTENIPINGMKKNIMSQMQKNPKITAKLLAEKLGIADRNVKNHIKALKQAGLINREGSTKGGYWVVNQRRN
jgi:ATP-dependent DNA helicase RecG